MTLLSPWLFPRSPTRPSKSLGRSGKDEVGKRGSRTRMDSRWSLPRTSLRGGNDRW